MSKPKYYYKVVRQEEVELGIWAYKSFFKIPKAFECEYQLKNTTKAKIGGCFVFKKLADADEWASYWGQQYIILRCFCTEPVKIPENGLLFPARAHQIQLIDKRDMERCWRGTKKTDLVFWSREEANKVMVFKKVYPVSVV